MESRPTDVAASLVLVNVGQVFHTCRILGYGKPTYRCGSVACTGVCRAGFHTCRILGPAVATSPTRQQEHERQTQQVDDGAGGEGVAQAEHVPHRPHRYDDA